MIQGKVEVILEEMILLATLERKVPSYSRYSRQMAGFPIGVFHLAVFYVERISGGRGLVQSQSK